MAPTAFHRIRFRQGDKERILRVSNVLAIVGIASMGISITLAITLIADLLFGVAAAVAVGMSAFVVMGVLWFAYPSPGGRATSSDGSGPVHGVLPRLAGFVPHAAGDTRADMRLRMVSVDSPGIARTRAGRGFAYSHPDGARAG